MNPSADLVNRLWRLCSLLRKDGITYQQYVTELTYLLFLKMVHEFGAEATPPPSGRWSDLLRASDEEKLDVYRNVLATLADAPKAEPVIRRIFAKSSTAIRESDNLAKLVSQIDKIGWFSESRDNFGDLYEGILDAQCSRRRSVGPASTLPLEI